MHREPRNATVDKIVVHVNVGPEVEGGARSLVAYLARINGGYHKVTDDVLVATCAQDDELVWGASGMNRRGLHVCIVGQASQTSEQWHDPYSTAAVRNAAIATAVWCKAYGIPAVKLDSAQVATAGVRGICGHKDVEMSGLPNTGGPSGHWDPGPAFPWDEFVGQVRQMLDPTPTPPIPPPIEVPPKVRPKYDPPQIREPIVDDCDCPSGGVWELAASGAVYTPGKKKAAPYHGGANGKPWNVDPKTGQQRKAARIEPWRYRTRLRYRWGYRIIFENATAHNFPELPRK